MAAAGGSRGRSGESMFIEELYQAGICMQESMRWIEAHETKMEEIAHSDSDYDNLPDFRKGMSVLTNRIFHLWHMMRATQHAGLIGNEGESMETLSKIGNGGEMAIVVVDIAKVFEEKKKIREEAMAVLRFGFRLAAFSEQIDELRHELCNFLRSFSSENKDIRNTMMKFISEPYLSCISKLQLISDRITMLQRMDSNFDSKVKTTIIKLKSESFLSAMEDELRRAGQEDSMEMEEKRFIAYHLYWERIWGRDGHSFENQTILSPMQFTHCTPCHIPIEAVAGSTLQIYSIKVSLVEPQKLPLEVYGVVAVRDAVDRHRNPLFLCSRQYCQTLKENDSLLHLTGPVRAIVSTDTVYIDIQLIVKGRTKSEDTTLISTFGFYNADNSCIYLTKNALCKVELCCEQLKQSVQATILSVAVTPEQESLLFPHGGRVVCYSVPQAGNEDISAQVSSRQVLLLDSEGGRMPMASNGYLYLTRHVVSVELNGKLLVLIMAGSQSQTVIAAQFLLQPENATQVNVNFLADGSKVEITVAWSLIPRRCYSQVTVVRTV
ncbi:hypothetical protein ZWY2020_015118 [Hordeum vulgare]|nr:hypothetical protein ZWY2020_015118 [Hordeum vulgare]